jgi:UDP-N-acetylglucosamine--N-acetylmuramyl-(pentapeptide) pyrophosphoryl-undecaprenol N-acetylglucosamine transferase
MKSIERIIISGGGTGGHIFPAIAIANQIKKENPQVDILFVGAEGKMEMEKVPKAGYAIEALPIAGFQRKLSFQNVLLPFKILKSLWIARKIIKRFQPQLAIGVGGYASGPLLKMATSMKIPSVIQEQNSFPGKTNKLLAKSVQKICVAYDGLERFFPKEKIYLTGNPVRLDMVDVFGKKEKGLQSFGLRSNVPTLLIIGGSLGARTLNQSIEQYLDKIRHENVQLIWQCGAYYAKELKEKYANRLPDNVFLSDFIYTMDLAYAAADVIVSRAGAISVSELCLVKKPIILVPSPNVAEDHQTKNARALVEKEAALMVKDEAAKETLIPMAIHLLNNAEQCKTLAQNIEKLGKAKATEDIVALLYDLV